MNERNLILVTGAGGFIGRHLCHTLRLRGIPFRAASRKQDDFDDADTTTIPVGDIDGHTDWCEALRGCDTVCHLAARAHMPRETLSDWDLFFKVNVEGSVALARQAANSGARRFVFVSSIGVLGNANVTPFDSESPTAPVGLYAKSKLMAEQALRSVCDETGLELVVIRPPLIYGPKVPGNFLSLLKLIDKGFPLPFGSITALRSFVGIENLCDFLIECAAHPKAVGETLLISDGEDIALPQLLRTLADATELPLRLLPVPPALFKLAGKLTGRSDQVHRLISGLQVDSSRSRELLGWVPPVSLTDGLRSTAIWYRRDKG